MLTAVAFSHFFPPTPTSSPLIFFSVAPRATSFAFVPFLISLACPSFPEDPLFAPLLPLLPPAARVSMLLFVRSTSTGLSLLCLHGRQKQQKRLDTFQDFVSRRSPCCLISTDLAARGIDFVHQGSSLEASQGTNSDDLEGGEGLTAVDLVIQFDCPDSVDTHIHRVGRTARFTRKGRAILLLLPSEVSFVEELQAKGMALQRINVNPNKAVRVESKLQALLAAEGEGCLESPLPFYTLALLRVLLQSLPQNLGAKGHCLVFALSLCHAEQEAYQRERLQFRADGTAKVKGLAAASTNSHILFSDEDPSETEALPEEAHEPQDSSSREVARDLREEFLQQMRSKMEFVRQHDKERDQQRVRERHLKKRKKERKARKGDAVGTTTVLGGDTSEEESFSEASASEESAEEAPELPSKVVRGGPEKAPSNRRERPPKKQKREAFSLEELEKMALRAAAA
ncbi:dead deah box helicase domain-containing protein [Cyclospora cayetanensis]|uniref:ATP-dependent RNA helicase n=1 Tax=Cyclospora cayetanensis TaxID=88456 RepID=A0A1D3D4Z4_9EIME|nr:dead deah box helicase domain-containing protein [Cyclospora cayetanensis]